MSEPDVDSTTQSLVRQVITGIQILSDRFDKLERQQNEMAAKYHEMIKCLTETQRSVIESIKINSITVRATNSDSGRIAPKSAASPVGEVKLDGTIKQSNIKVISTKDEDEPEPEPEDQSPKPDQYPKLDQFRMELIAVIRDDVKIFSSSNRELSIKDVLVGPLKKPHLANAGWEMVLEEVDSLAKLTPGSQGSSIYTKIVDKINLRIGN